MVSDTDKGKELMAQIEAASNRTAEDISDTEPSVPEEVFKAVLEK